MNSRRRPANPKTDVLPLQSLQGGGIAFTLHGEPRGWGRARIRVIVPKDPRKKPFPSFYVDAETDAYKRALALAAKVAMRGRNRLMTGALKVVVTAWMPIPKSWSHKKRDAALAGVLRPATKPDWDNIAKMLDALNEVAWDDDMQIVDGRAIKFYAEQPRLEVKVDEIGLTDLEE